MHGVGFRFGVGSVHLLDAFEETFGVHGFLYKQIVETSLAILACEVHFQFVEESHLLLGA